MTTFKSTIKKIPLTNLSIGEVQRVEGIDQRRVDKFANDFKPHALGVVTVSERSNATMVVLDGQHRVAAARKAGWTGNVDAKVFVGLTIAEEAELFYFLNSGRMPSALSKFQARVQMGDKQAVAIAEILNRHGWKVDPADIPGCLAAIDAVDRVYRNGGGTLPEGDHADVLDRTIEILTIAWEWDSKSVHSFLILAVAQLVGRFGASIDTKKLIDEMQATRPGVLIGRAKTLRDVQGGTVPAALAKILAGLHNKKRRNNLLPEWVWIR